MCMCGAVDGMGINFLNVAKFNLPNVSQHWCILHYLTCQRVLKPQNPTVCRSWHENNLWTLLWALCMNTLTCVMLHVLRESWWWCVGAVREGRNCGSLFAPCGGAEWWLVSLGGTDHLPLAILHSSSPQFPEKHRYRRWSNMVQWIIFSIL